MTEVTPDTVADALRPLRILIVKHSHTPPGLIAEDCLYDYLAARIARTVMLAHPFPDARSVPPESHWREQDRDAGSSELWGWRGHGPAACYYVRDVAETVRRVLFGGRRWDVFVGVDNLNAAVGIVLRRLGLVRSVIFYVIDYVPQRFENRWMNGVYHFIERFAARHADCTWNLSPRMIEGRAERGLPESKAGPQLVVSTGANLPAAPATKASAPTAVFMGHLATEQGVDLLLAAWAHVVAAVPTAILCLAGSGRERERLDALAAEQGIGDSVRWLGFVPDEELHATLGAAWVAVAPYPRAEGTFKEFANPGKLRWYCAAGLPIVLTDVPAVGADLENAGVALVAPATAEAIADALTRVLTDPALRTEMGAAACRLRKDYTWDTLFNAAWASSWPHLRLS